MIILLNYDDQNTIILIAPQNKVPILTKIHMIIKIIMLIVNMLVH